MVNVLKINRILTVPYLYRIESSRSSLDTTLYRKRLQIHEIFGAGSGNPHGIASEVF
jgi:hypothetical protein